MDEGRGGVGSGKIWGGGVRGGVEIVVVRRKVGFLWMRRGAGRFTGGYGSKESWRSSDEGDDGQIMEFGERGDEMEHGWALPDLGEDGSVAVSLGWGSVASPR